MLFGACAGDANRSNSANKSNSSNSSNRSNETNKPSCLPPGYRSRVQAAEGCEVPQNLPGEELDVKLAVVEGRVITRRRLVREAGRRAPGQSEADYERSIHRRLVERARILIWVREAQRVGVNLPPAQVDQIVESSLRTRIDEVEETTGRRVTAREYLAEKNMTPVEFREQAKEELYYQAVMLRLVRGLGPDGRPQVDMNVAPSDVRRIYWSHPGAFDETAGVRFAIFQLQIDGFAGDGVTFLQAEEQARAEAERLAQVLRTGAKPVKVASQFKLNEGDWIDSGQFAERDNVAARVGEEKADWIFDPSRKPGDATIYEEGPGPLVVTIREIRQSRRIPYDEAYAKIVRMIGFVRQKRLEEERLIEILTTRDVVEPDQLQNQLLMDAQRTLHELSKDPVLRAARFR